MPDTSVSGASGGGNPLSAMTRRKSTTERMQDLVHRFVAYGLPKEEAERRARIVLGIKREELSKREVIDQQILLRVMQRVLTHNLLPRRQIEDVRSHLHALLRAHPSDDPAERVSFILKELRAIIRGEKNITPSVSLGHDAGKNVAENLLDKLNPIEREELRERERRKKRAEESTIQAFTDATQADHETEQVASSGREVVEAVGNESMELSPFEKYIAEKESGGSEESKQNGEATAAVGGASGNTDNNVSFDNLDDTRDVAASDTSNVPAAIRLYDDDVDDSVLMVDGATKNGGVAANDTMKNNASQQLQTGAVTAGDTESKAQPSSSARGNEPTVSAPSRSTSGTVADSKGADKKQSGTIARILSKLFSRNESESSPDDQDDEVLLHDTPVRFPEVVDDSQIETPITPRQRKYLEEVARSKEKTERFFTSYAEQKLTELRAVLEEHNVPNQDEILDKLGRFIQQVIAKEGASLADKVELLDARFDEERGKYEFIGTVRPLSDEELVAQYLALAQREVHVGNVDADARFQETLRNALQNKIKLMRESGATQNEIEESLRNEYNMMRKFYLTRGGAQ